MIAATGVDYLILHFRSDQGVETELLRDVAHVLTFFITSAADKGHKYVDDRGGVTVDLKSSRILNVSSGDPLKLFHDRLTNWPVRYCFCDKHPWNNAQF